MTTHQRKTSIGTGAHLQDDRRQELASDLDYEDCPSEDEHVNLRAARTSTKLGTSQGVVQRKVARQHCSREITSIKINSKTYAMTGCAGSSYSKCNSRKHAPTIEYYVVTKGGGTNLLTAGIPYLEGICIETNENKTPATIRRESCEETAERMSNVYHIVTENTEKI